MNAVQISSNNKEYVGGDDLRRNRQLEGSRLSGVTSSAQRCMYVAPHLSNRMLMSQDHKVSIQKTTSGHWRPNLEAPPIRTHIS